MRTIAGLLHLTLALMVAASAARADPSFALEGKLTQGGLVIGHVAPGAAVRLDGEPVKVAPDGRFVIGFGRDAPPAHLIEVVTADVLEGAHHLLVGEVREEGVGRLGGFGEAQGPEDGAFLPLPPGQGLHLGEEGAVLGGGASLL